MTQMITISLLTALLITGYRLAAGCPWRGLLLSVAVVCLLPVLDPSLQGLHPTAYMLAGIVVLAGVLFVLPAVDGRNVVTRWQLPRLTIAIAVVRTEGVSYAQA